jgi:N-acetylneuraminate synthase
MKAGEVITSDAVRSVRPGFGMPPKYYDMVLGKRISRDAFVGTPLAWDMLT